jgi:hypothetical protein
MNLNEATLEARISRVLATTFPTFKEVDVQHQKSFSIKFGHHEVSVDLKEPLKHPSKAIFDILLTIGGVNVILLELKREGLPLIPEDVDQGISYARLLHPITPITLISNGKDNWFYNTYTKEKIERNDIDFTFVKEITNTSFQLAVNDFKDAVNLLLNKEPEIFSKVINQISEAKFSRLSGEIGDFNKPICREFSIERKALTKIHSLFAKRASIVGIIGSAFSGKTNLMFQFFEKTKSDYNFLLYIDCSDHNYSILQQLANHFTENAKVLITKNKIREWLINSISYNVNAKFFLMLDNFNNEIPEIIKIEVIELIDIFKGINHHTLFSIDEFNYKKIAFVENRQYKTIIGEQSQILKLDELNDEEYKYANNILSERFRIAIEHGGHFTPEYREPRILRQLAILYDGDIEEGCISKIIAVPDLEHLKFISKNKTYTKQVHDLCRKISYCFLTEHELRKKDADLNIIASGSGAISTNIFKKNFPDDFESLTKSSLIVFRELRSGVSVIYPKLPELIARHSIEIVTEIIIKLKDKKEDVHQICVNLIDIVTPIPYCDIVATGVLMAIADKGEVDLFSNLVQELLKIPPRIEKIDKGTKALMYSEGVGHINLNFDDDIDDGAFIADFLPYAILSQLAGHPLKLVASNDYSPYAFHLYLLNELGSNENFIRRADVRSIQNMKPYISHEIEGIGTLICEKEGIIEPIVQSIQRCFLIIPNEMEILFNRAFNENNIPLLWRIYLALLPFIDVTDEAKANQAKNFVEKFQNRFKELLPIHSL